VSVAIGTVKTLHGFKDKCHRLAFNGGNPPDTLKLKTRLDRRPVLRRDTSTAGIMFDNNEWVKLYQKSSNIQYNYSLKDTFQALVYVKWHDTLK